MGHLLGSDNEQDNKSLNHESEEPNEFIDRFEELLDQEERLNDIERILKREGFLFEGRVESKNKDELFDKGGFDKLSDKAESDRIFKEHNYSKPLDKNQVIDLNTDQNPLIEKKASRKSEQANLKPSKKIRIR